MDEIDAPLDEANIDRFCDALKEFTQQSQFLIITHNKKTMTIADVLYGVTMERPGISQIISVKMTKPADTAALEEAAPARVDSYLH
jgi:chromosome segregation protein